MRRGTPETGTPAGSLPVGREAAATKPAPPAGPAPDSALAGAFSLDGVEAGPWPTLAQTLLLRAGLLRGSDALEAWECWKSTHDLFASNLDRSSTNLLPLVYRSLRALGANEPAMGALKGLYRYWWCSNQDTLHRVATVLEQLRAKSIETLVLDGAATSLLYHKDPGARPIDVIHLMVRGEQAPSAVQVLQGRGWRDASGRLDGDMRYRHSTRLLAEPGRELDLHWHALREGLDVDVDRGFWQRSVPLAIGDAETRALAPGDALLYAVMQGVRGSAGSAVGGIADAMAILGATEGRLDWEAVVREALGRRIELHVAGTLDYLIRTFAAPVSVAVTARLTASTPCRIQRLEKRYLTGWPTGGRAPRIARAAVSLALDYLRVVAGRSTLAKARTLPGFLRYRWGGRIARMTPPRNRSAANPREVSA